MAVVTIIAIIALATAGGAGIYGIVESVSRKGGPDLSNSTIGNLEYDARSKNAIIDIDVDLRKSGLVTEMAIVCIIGVLGSLCCLYQCCRRETRMWHGLCFDDQDEAHWRIKRAERRERIRSKKIIDHRRKKVMRQARLDTIQEIEDLNHEKEIKKHDDAQAEKIAKVHKLRPSAMARPYKTRRILPKVNVTRTPLPSLGWRT